MSRRSERVPSWIPEWLKRRIEVDIYALQDFGDEMEAMVADGAYTLDAGAGEGRFKGNLAHTHYIGVDLAVGDATWDYSGLDVICDLTDLPFTDAAFDAAVCTQVLEHVPQPLQVLREIRRVLNPGARFFLSAPQSWPQHQKPHDFYRYTSFGLQHLIARAGMQVESLRPIGGYFWFLSLQLQNMNYWLFPRGMRGRRWTWPLRALFGYLFQLGLPVALFYLDRLDRTKDETMGYLCIAVKPENEG